LTGELNLNLLQFGKKEIEIFPKKLDLLSESLESRPSKANPAIYRRGSAYTRRSSIHKGGST